MLPFKKWLGLAPLLPSADSEVPAFIEAHCLAQIQQGNRQAFQTLLEHYYDLIYQIAYRFTGHTEDAEDITQEVCLGLANKILSYRGEAKFKTWLYSIVINTCLDAQRKTKHQQSKINPYLEFAEQHRNFSQENAQQISWLYRQLASLKEPYKETAFLVLAQDLSHAEVGQILGCAESTISGRMSEIRQQLKAQMENDHDR
ncbi:RNA polymerase sigma factor [Methylomonas sp. AM2-LC]|uniref:RNA polymerase sigma factor n=1 Tax=Methylomonas sp. AM2-LC TaxID=3153301 RepID=UPI00326638A1